MGRRVTGMSTAHPPKCHHFHTLHTHTHQPRSPDADPCVGPQLENCQDRCFWVQRPSSGKNKGQSDPRQPARLEVPQLLKAGLVPPLKRGNLGRRVTGTQAPTPPLWTRPWDSARVISISDSGGPTWALQAGVPALRRPLVAVCANASPTPPAFLLSGVGVRTGGGGVRCSRQD